ncbi:hypothetical protein K9B32_27365 [Rhizobium sp. 3T7]|uniref:hypothetical protein n=1 Tax=Rhizobium sp. 3T7 TaxID=2874922 RepID=UPI001CCB9DB7|nr:hypothetical protein [Rhizobium sp. 3T7]MBZ9793781.1 hypothetical protein [Rhizobium sp. 3T7]
MVGAPELSELNDGSGSVSSLPPSIRAIQQKFRPKFGAQDRRMEARAAAAFANMVSSTTVTHKLPVEALAPLDAVSEGLNPLSSNGRKFRLN